MKQIYKQDIENIRENIDELLQLRKTLWDEGKRNECRKIGFDIEELNQRIRAIEEAYGDTADTMIDMDSFGSELPQNWQEIASYMNDMIENGRDTDELWESYWGAYWAGNEAFESAFPNAPKPIKRVWYAVMRDRDDADWGFGSYDRDEAFSMLRDQEDPSAYIAVIVNDVCEQEIEKSDI